MSNSQKGQYMALSSPSTSKLLATLTQVPVDDLFSIEEIQSIQPNGPIPLYHQLYLIMRNRIVSGQLVAGTMLPSERAASLLGISVTAPVLTLQRRVYDSTGKNIDYVFVQYRPERFEFASAIGDPSLVEHSVIPKEPVACA